MVTGYMTSRLKAYGTYMKQLEGGMGRLEFNTMVDFMGKGVGKKCNFGVTLNLGPG